MVLGPRPSRRRSVIPSPRVRLCLVRPRDFLRMKAFHSSDTASFSLLSGRLMLAGSFTSPLAGCSWMRRAWRPPVACLSFMPVFPEILRASSLLPPRLPPHLRLILLSQRHVIPLSQAHSSPFARRVSGPRPLDCFFAFSGLRTSSAPSQACSKALWEGNGGAYVEPPQTQTC